MASESVRTCITSPPYFNQRDYGHSDQIGLESTPDEYVSELVDVFREVKRVLRDDGTLWLNLGDSYVTTPKGSGGRSGLDGRPNLSAVPRSAPGLKPKDLIGIPWSVAKALQLPFYVGRIPRERDRVWLAAMIDGEGTICGFGHTRKDDGSRRTGVHVFVTNSSDRLIKECLRIWPASRSEHTRPSEGHLGLLDVDRWIVHGIENKMLMLREIYPYLVAKREQAAVAYTMLEMMVVAKQLGHSPQRDSVREKRQMMVDLMSDLNHARPVVLPSWIVKPPSVLEPGFYLRQDIIWEKPNTMPESVTDRCTKSHEYVFLLSKSENYFYDAAAIAEPAVTGWNGSEFDTGKTGEHQLGRAQKRHDPGQERTAWAPEGQTAQMTKRARPRFGDSKPDNEHESTGMRNKRDVWTIPTKSFCGAHFAVMPEALVEPCVLAGSQEGDTVLDPFAGSGTVGVVALRHQRNFVGIELNPEYAQMALKRIEDDAPLLNAVEILHSQEHAWSIPG